MSIREIKSREKETNKRDRKRFADRLKDLMEQKEVLFVQIGHLRSEEEQLQDMVDIYKEEAEELEKQVKDAREEMRRLELD